MGRASTRNETSLGFRDQHARENQSPVRLRRPIRPSTFSSLHNRNFRLFLTGQLFSFTGTWVQRIAQDWLVLTLTGSATAVGITTALQFLPTLLFGLIGGMLADRNNKRRLLYLTLSCQSALAATLAVLDAHPSGPGLARLHHCLRPRHVSWPSTTRRGSRS